jgi:hypothetical protein
MILKMGVDTLWCYAGQDLAAPDGGCGVGGRRALGVGSAACWYSLGREHISAFGMTLKMGVETLWCYAGLLG